MPRGGRTGVRKRRAKARWPGARLRRVWRALRRASPLLRVTVLVGGLTVLALGINFIYQVVRKPTELFFPVSGTLYKTPEQSWREYGSLYRKYSTERIPAELLAALAQVEGSGNPVVRTYWRWAFRREPFEVYRPASSAVGMYQMTDSTFEEARRYCIRDHVVIDGEAVRGWHGCWLNQLYFRVIPSHAVELTAAYLDRHVAQTLAHGPRHVDAREVEQLAALIHLCGAGAGDAFVRRGLRLLPGQRCGDHDARAYLGRVAVMRGVFTHLAAHS
jgi:Transglycosylase SLT domain